MVVTNFVVLYIAIVFKPLGTPNHLRYPIIILISILYPVAIDILYNVRRAQHSEQYNVLANPCIKMTSFICFG